MVQSRIAFLRSVPIFADLDEASLQELATRCRRREYKAHQTIFSKGDKGFTLFIILTGSVNIQMEVSGGRVVHIAQRGIGEQFGELSLFDGKPRMADAVTAEPCTLLLLEREDFLQCLSEYPQIAVKIMSCLAERLREAGEQLKKQHGLDVLGRVSEMLLELATKYGVEVNEVGIRIKQKITQQEIAERIGATRESVSRSIAGLKEVGAIKMNGREIIVTNLRKLRQNTEL